MARRKLRPDASDFVTLDVTRIMRHGKDSRMWVPKWLCLSMLLCRHCYQEASQQSHPISLSWALPQIGLEPSPSAQEQLSPTDEPPGRRHRGIHRRSQTWSVPCGARTTRSCSAPPPRGRDLHAKTSRLHLPFRALLPSARNNPVLITNILLYC